MLLANILNVEGFGYYKLFTLYLAYIGITSFGFREAVYYELCKEKLSSRALNTRYSYFLYTQLFTSSLIFMIGYYWFDIELWMVSVFTMLAFSNNLASYYIDYFKAEKAFGEANLVALYAVIIKKNLLLRNNVILAVF